MSCNCGDNDLEPLTNAAIVLTKNDLYKIRTGRIIREHFHGSNLEYGKMTFFVSNEQNRVAETKLEESNPHYMEHVRDFLKYAKWEIVEEYDRQRNGGPTN